MVKLEYRIMPWCKECRNFEPNVIGLPERTANRFIVDKRIVIECQHADICSHAVHQYQKTCEDAPKIKSDPSPCKDCTLVDQESCNGCDDYYEWRKKYDD